MLGRVLRSLQVSPRSCRTYRAWSCYWGGTKKNSGARLSEAEGKQKKKKRKRFLLSCSGLVSVCAHLFVLEGLHQLGHAAESHGEAQTRAGVAGQHLHALVAEVPLPVCIATYFVLAEDVRDEVPYVEKREINFPLTQNWDLSRGSQRSHLTFAAGWSEVVHQEAKEVVELQKKREKTIILKEKNLFCSFFDSVFDDVNEPTTLNRECK